jgi:hypothetical protein
MDEPNDIAAGTEPRQAVVGVDHDQSNHNEDSDEANSSGDEGGNQSVFDDMEVYVSLEGVFDGAYDIWQLFEDAESPRTQNLELQSLAPPAKVVNAFESLIDGTGVKLDRFDPKLLDVLFKDCDDGVADMEDAAERFTAIFINCRFFVFDSDGTVQELRYHPENLTQILENDTITYKQSDFKKLYPEYKVSVKQCSADKKGKQMPLFKWLSEHCKHKRRVINTADKGTFRDGLFEDVRGDAVQPLSKLDLIQRCLIAVVNAAEPSAEQAVDDDDDDGTALVAGEKFELWQLGDKILKHAEDQQLLCSPIAEALQNAKAKSKTKAAAQSYNQQVGIELEKSLGAEAKGKAVKSLVRVALPPCHPVTLSPCHPVTLIFLFCFCFLGEMSDNRS